MPEEEIKFGTGGICSPRDDRDYLFAGTPEKFDFERGFDIEIILGYRLQCATEAHFWGDAGREGWSWQRYLEILKDVEKRKIKPFKIPVNDQMSTQSCTGQSLSKYSAVLNMLETGSYTEISPRDIYAYTAIGNGAGAYLRDGLKIICDRGAAKESLVNSWYGDGKTDEKLVTTKPVETDEIKKSRLVLQNKAYVSVNRDINQAAWALFYNFGLYVGVRGDNNGSWRKEYPVVAKRSTWGHAIMGGKAGYTKGREYIDILNSWSEKTGIKGWQKLRNEWFEHLDDDGYRALMEAWTLQDKPNNAMFELIKVAGNPAVWIKWADGTRSYFFDGDQFDALVPRLGLTNQPVKTVSQEALNAIPMAKPVVVIK